MGLKKFGVCQVWASFTESKATRLTSYQDHHETVVVYDYLGYICLWDGLKATSACGMD